MKTYFKKVTFIMTVIAYIILFPCNVFADKTVTIIGNTTATAGVETQRKEWSTGDTDQNHNLNVYANAYELYTINTGYTIDLSKYSHLTLNTVQASGSNKYYGANSISISIQTDGGATLLTCSGTNSQTVDVKSYTGKARLYGTSKNTGSGNCFPNTYYQSPSISWSYNAYSLTAIQYESPKINDTNLPK